MTQQGYSYKIRRGAPFKQDDAAAIAAALQQIMEQRGGKITAADVLEAASQEEHPLHKYFEWDDAAAAKHYRLNQARQIIKAVQYEVKTGQITIEIGAFVRIFNTDQLPRAAPGPGYVALPVAVENVDFKEQTLSRALQELRSFQARYRTLSMVVTELKPLIEAIGVTEGLLQQRRAAK
jgi:hypothetical protein